MEWHSQFVTGEIAWMATATVCLLLLLWPGLLLSFGGLLCRRDLARSAPQWLTVLAVLCLVWGLWSYSLAFAPSWENAPAAESAPPIESNLQELMERSEKNEDKSREMGRGGVIGGLEYAGLRGLAPNAGTRLPIFPTRRPAHHLPHLLFMAFQMIVFVAIQAPLLLVALDGSKFGRLVLFAVVWGTLVYPPVAHAVWGDGWLSTRGALDLGGGLLHLSVGCSALACAVAFGPGDHPAASAGVAPAPTGEPDSGDLLRAASGTLFVWCGACALHASGGILVDSAGQASVAFFNTILAAIAGLLAWKGTSHFVWKTASPFDPCAGALAGVVAVAAGSGYVAPQSALAVGVAAGVTGSVVLGLLRGPIERRPALLVFVIQGVPAILGILLAGVFATSGVAPVRHDGTQVEGLIGGNAGQLAVQGIAVAAASAWAFGATLLIALLMNLVARLQGNAGSSIDSESPEIGM